MNLNEIDIIICVLDPLLLTSNRYLYKTLRYCQNNHFNGIISLIITSGILFYLDDIPTKFYSTIQRFDVSLDNLQIYRININDKMDITNVIRKILKNISYPVIEYSFVSIKLLTM